MDTKRLRELRAGDRVSLKQLADVIGKSVQGYKMKEDGQIKFTPSEVVKLADFYHLTFQDANSIFYDSEVPVDNFDQFIKCAEAFGLD